MTNKQFMVQLKARQKAIAAERDKLRDLISEVDDLSETCDKAVDQLERAADALSELV